MFYKLKYMSRSRSIAASTFSLPDSETSINLQHITVLSPLETFHRPLTGGVVGDYFSVTLTSGDNFICRGREYKALTEIL
tara:strand:+ start:662 stop:901 length:240 start_codon:yes stop_codon:yes gene_type:complete